MCIILALGLLILAGCGGQPAPVVPDSPGPSPDSPPPSADKTVLSPLAKSLGITSENYPKIDGSTSTLPIVQALFSAMFETDADGSYPQSASKTVPSYDLLIEGSADMIIVPYASEEVLGRAEAAGAPLVFTPIVFEALVFITAADNPVENITLDQVREIYLHNSVNNWTELGGDDRTLIPICRNSDSGSQSQMDNLVLENKPMHPSIAQNYVELTMEGMLEQVAFYHNGGLEGSPTNSYALGYTLYTYLQSMDKMTGIGERLKILSFVGVEPTEQSITGGDYPLTDGYYIVYREDLAADHPVRKITDWLTGDDGKELLRKLGYMAG